MHYVNDLKADGRTNIYLPVMKALEIYFNEVDKMHNYLTGILLLTDGRTNIESLEDIKSYWNSLNAGFDFPPIFGITFGDADFNQLNELVNFSVGKVFDGKKHGLEYAFRKAKGYY